MVVVRQPSSSALIVSGKFCEVIDEAAYDYKQNRYISINDNCRDQRDAWVEQVFVRAPKYNFSDDDTKGLSRHPEGYGVLVVGGNDIARMGRFLKANRSAISGVLKICVTCGANAQKRAQALMAGFDDVFDSEKMQSAEAAARVHAMRRRYVAAIEIENDKVKSDRVMSEFVQAERLTERERLIIEAMLDDKNNFVSYARVQQLCSDFHNQVSFENVKVIVCNLRKKLKPGVRISAQAHKGYMLRR